jgi:hypothetical protein
MLLVLLALAAIVVWALWPRTARADAGSAPLRVRAAAPASAGDVGPS